MKMSPKNLIYNLSSKLFQPITVAPPQAATTIEKLQLPKSYKLMLDLGIIRPASTGTHTILPLGIRALDKFRSIVKDEMAEIHAQEVKLPYLTDSSLWKKSGRWNNQGLGIFTLKDRHEKEIILSPTNEELAADLIASIPQLSHRNLPILIYQMSTKFRDEIKPRCGLLKTKEFEMKDLYSFDKCIESAKTTYETVSDAYLNIFKRINIPVLRVNADTGDMKGIFSHEYHIKTGLGEDNLIFCKTCGFSFNSENEDVKECRNCKSNSLEIIKGVEVGHTFLLGTVYSKPLNAEYMTPSGKPEPLVMASYGLGLTRTLAAAVEYLSTEDRIIWPRSLAPFSVVLITPKSGSKEHEVGKRLTSDLYLKLNQVPRLFNDILIDDLDGMTIGKRLRVAKRTGYPYIVIAGSKITQNPPLFEVHDTLSDSHHFMTFEEVISYFLKGVDEILPEKVFA